MDRKPDRPLRRGWTTGACATAATRAAYTALLTGEFPDPVAIRLPNGETPAFALASEGLDPQRNWASAGIIKDAGDDPDVTHGALVISTVSQAAEGQGIRFSAGEGVGTVTKPGLPVGVGEPAINPVPRRMMSEAIQELAAELGAVPDVEIEIAIPDGAELAEKTWNPRLGIVGGLSILGTTGVVVPYSCAAWIHSIHRGIDVARATGAGHVGAATGSTSEAALRRETGLEEDAVIDMGDFAGGMFKYLRNNPVPCITLAGGFAKLTKLAQGYLDLHSGRSTVDFGWLAERMTRLGADRELIDNSRMANTANEVLALAQGAEIPIADDIAARARETSLGVLRGAPVDVAIMVVDRSGTVVGRAGQTGRG